MKTRRTFSQEQFCSENPVAAALFVLSAHSRTRRKVHKSSIKTSQAKEDATRIETKMNATLSFVLLLIVLPFQVGGVIFHQRLPLPSSGGRHLQREENESDSPNAAFLAETTAAIVTPDPTEDFSNFVAFIDALVASASASDDSSFSSNWTSSLDHSGDGTEDTNVNFTPEWMNDQIDQAVGSEFSSSGEFENTVGSDINMADGETAPSTAVVNQLPYVGLTLSITLQVVVLVL